MTETRWWFPEYVPVKSPHEDRRGWFFPYSGDEWPDRDGWCWVWTEWHQERRGLPPKLLWWSQKEQRFMAIRPVDAVAWRYAVETAESIAAGRKVRRNLGRKT